MNPSTTMLQPLTDYDPNSRMREGEYPLYNEHIYFIVMTTADSCRSISDQTIYPYLSCSYFDSKEFFEIVKGHSFVKACKE